MPELGWNQKTWAQAYDWSQEGEEWSKPWGLSEAQWFGSLYPRLHHFLPAKNILEIAPGRGRWTRFLLPQAQESFRSVDLAQDNVDLCNTKFKMLHNDFLAVANDGKDLSAIADRSYDFIFSFDSLVHVNTSILSSYIKQILSSLLTQNGVCFLHHSNMKYSMAKYKVPPLTHNRDFSVDAGVVNKIITENGGKVLLQEIISWGDRKLPDWPEIKCGDALVLFTKIESERKPANPPLIVNKKFITAEADNIRTVLSHYSFADTGKEPTDSYYDKYRRLRQTYRFIKKLVKRIVRR